MVSAGRKINFNERALNFVNLTIGADAGSCPYLLFKQSDGEWVNNGKILHMAKGRAKEQTELVRFSGLVDRFRLEEREPERAQIETAALSVMLDNGSVIELAAKPSLPLPEPSHMELFWGESSEFSFELPEWILPSQVVESHLALTGFYERYSVLTGQSRTEVQEIEYTKGYVNDEKYSN